MEDILEQAAAEEVVIPATDDIEVVVEEAGADAPRMELGADLSLEDEPKPKPGQTPAEHKESLQDRNRKLTFRLHEAERQRQEALRQRAAAVSYAEGIHGQYINLQKGYVGTHKAAVASGAAQASAELEALQVQLREANEAANFGEVAKLTAKMSQAAARQQQIAAIPTPDELPPPPPLQFEAEQPPQKTDTQKAWEQKNPWFKQVGGLPQNEESAYAFRAHAQLLSAGVEPETPEYYSAIDNAMRAQYPRKFTPQNGAQRPAQPLVAPATRTAGNGSSPRSVTLSPSEAAIARATLLKYTGGDEAKALRLYAEQKLRDTNA